MTWERPGAKLNHRVLHIIEQVVCAWSRVCGKYDAGNRHYSGYPKKDFCNRSCSTWLS